MGGPPPDAPDRLPQDLVAALEAVLPTGDVVRSKVSPRRGTGPDVASLMIGSEGALIPWIYWRFSLRT